MREFRPADGPALVQLFRDTVRRINCRDYSPEQIAAWAPDEIDKSAWIARFAGRFTRVAEIDGVLVGFTELEPDGHIDRFYVAADFQGCGVGGALMQSVTEKARRRVMPRIFAEVSITARPFFERRGFHVLAKQTVILRGVAFSNYRMERLFA